MTATRLAGLVIMAMIMMGTVACGTPAVPADPPESTAPAVMISASTDRLSITALPCDQRGAAIVSLTNQTGTPRFVDARLSGSPGMIPSRGVFSTYLPAASDQTVTAKVSVTAKQGTRPGPGWLAVSAEGSQLRIPVTVEPLPADGPDDNLALYRQAFSSSTYSGETLCGGVDGNTDSAQWGASGTHDATSGVFPDSYGVTLAKAYPISRIELYTLDSAKYPAAKMGIRDFDLQVHAAGQWHTVATYRDNVAGHLTATFDPVTADQVQVITYDSNDHKFSRIIELEVYQH